MSSPLTKDELPPDPFELGDLDITQQIEPLQVGGYTFSYAFAGDSAVPGAPDVTLVSGEAEEVGSSAGPVGRLWAVLVSRTFVEGVNVSSDAEDDSEEIFQTEEESDDSTMDFHDMCRTTGQEVGECAAALFDARGRPRGAFRRRLHEAPSMVGGFLYVEELHLLKAHRGKDVGLDFLQGLLLRLRPRWTLAVIFPAGAPPLGRAVDAVERLARHFARIGFVQVATCEPQLHYWFLRGSDRPIRLSLAQAAGIAVAAPRTPNVMCPADQELRAACLGTPEDKEGLGSGAGAGRVQPTPARLRALVANGADPGRAHALHVCVANADLESARELLDLGAGVSERDAHGSTPLHVAASLCGRQGMLAIVCALISNGARLDAQNDEGLTPLHCAREAKRDAKTCRRRATGGALSAGRGAVAACDSCIALLSKFIQQPERMSQQVRCQTCAPASCLPHCFTPLCEPGGRG